MKLRVVHETRYDYEPGVDVAQHIAYLQPLNNERQQLVSHALEITPEPALRRLVTDVFGNTRCYFSLQAPHRVLQVVARSVVETMSYPLPASSSTWEQTRERFRYRAGARFPVAAEFVFASPHVPRQAEFADYARPSFGAGVAVLAAAKDLMQRIYKDFTYTSKSTEIDTPAAQALQQRTGVCQDFAHIMIACLRSMGVPARYVSGYLLTRPAPGTVKLRGSDASHAWVAVYLPDMPEDLAWCDFDPTNNRCGLHSPGEDYVTLATGRDFADVSPLRGVIHGGGDHTLTVAVTVEPADGQTQTRMPNQTQVQTLSNGQGQSQSQNQTQSQTQGATY